MPQKPFHNTEDFVHLFNQGDERGLAYIFDKLYPLLVYYANDRVKDKLLAEDIASMAFVKAWRHHGQLNRLAGIKAYLFTTVQRDCNRALFYEKKRKNTHQQATIEINETQTAFHSMVKAETYYNLHQAIKQLPAGMRAVIESIYMEGNNVTETAKILNISLGAVGTQKKRAIEKLSKTLPRLGIYFLSIFMLFLIWHSQV